MLRILVLTRYGRLGASSRLRFYQYLPYLEQHGIRFTVAPLLDDHYVAGLYAGRSKNFVSLAAAYLARIARTLMSRHYDLVWLEYELLPWLPAWPERVLHIMCVPYLVDYDDAIFHRYDHHSRAVIRRLLGHKIDTIMKQAAGVSAGNDYVISRARRAGARNVHYLPTVIDLDRYRVADETSADAQSAGTFRIGWIGSPITAKYLTLVNQALAAFSRDKSDVCFVVIGSSPQDLPGVQTEFHPWTEDTEVGLLKSVDVGIMPLTDNLWERGKCGYKLIQYMACGKPVIASPVGVNRQIVERGKNGFWADSIPEWIQILETLYKDRSLLRQMGQAGRAMIERNYCLQVTAPQLLTLIQQLAIRT